MQNAKSESWELTMICQGPGKKMGRHWCIFKTSEWLMLPPQGGKLAERITRSTWQPIREAGMDHNRHQISRSAPDNSLQGQRASQNWERHSSRASFAGLLDSLKGLWSFIYVTDSTFWIDSSDHMSHHSQWTKQSSRHHHLLPNSYDILLTDFPASILDPKYQRSMRGYWFAKLPEKSKVIPMEMGYQNL